nr:hypothetical protein CFP56_78370 [Quercus suber]
MDKISKRSKGYAFIEYTTEEAARAALKEMNGKVSFLPLRIFFVFFLCLMFKRRFVFLKFWFIFVDTAGVAPDRNFDKRTITGPLSSRSSKIFRLLLSRCWTFLVLPPKFCSMSTCKRQEPLSAPDLQVKQ